LPIDPTESFGDMIDVPAKRTSPELCHPAVLEDEFGHQPRCAVTQSRRTIHLHAAGNIEGGCIVRTDWIPLPNSATFCGAAGRLETQLGHLSPPLNLEFDDIFHRPPGVYGDRHQGGRLQITDRNVGALEG
jgi:hypothetical protein